MAVILPSASRSNTTEATLPEGAKSCETRVTKRTPNTILNTNIITMEPTDKPLSAKPKQNTEDTYKKLAVAEACKICGTPTRSQICPTCQTSLKAAEQLA